MRMRPSAIKPGSVPVGRGAFVRVRNIFHENFFKCIMMRVKQIKTLVHLFSLDTDEM